MKQRSMAGIINYWKQLPSFPKNMAMTVLIIGLEKLLEVEFKCPMNSLNIPYSLFFFFFPGILLLIVTCYIEKQSCCSAESGRCICKFWEICAPSYIWIAVLLTDGRYVECMLNKTLAGSRSPTDVYTISQMVGIAFIFLILLAYISFPFCKKKATLQNSGEISEGQEAVNLQETNQG